MMNWHSGPWVWDTSARPHWRAPRGTQGIDLRTLPQMSAQGNGGHGRSLFFGELEENKSDYADLGSGSWVDLKPTNAQRAMIGKNLTGDTLAEILLSTLTDRADPDGISGPKPIVPTTFGMTELHCGQSQSSRFKWGSRHGECVRDLIRKDFANVWERDPINDKRHPRKVLDFWQKKYGAHWREFVPVHLLPHVEGPLPHETTITDTFDRANSTISLGTSSGGWTWNAITGIWGINSNKEYTVSAIGWGNAQAQSDLSSTDHYAQGTIGNTGDNYFGPACRMAGSGLTFYQCCSDGATGHIYKLVAASQTDLVTATKSYTVGNVWKCEANGSTIRCLVNGTQVLTVTDTGISSGVRVGMAKYDASGDFGNLSDFEAADLAAAINKNAQKQNHGYGSII